MRILFNRDGSGTLGAQELSEITGSYYANNNFPKIRMDVELQTEKLIKLIGPEVYKLAEDTYYGTIADEKYNDLVKHIQLPIAVAAVLKFNQTNIVSHEDGGRKLKLNRDKESVPWEWMFDRDDQAHERKAFAAIDRLIDFLDASDLEQWKNSEAQKLTRGLFVNSVSVFQASYPIDDSGRFFHQVTPFIAEVERNTIRKALGTLSYKTLLAWHQNIEKETDQSSPDAVAGDLDNSLLLALIRECVPLLTMVIAVQRFSLSVLPEGVVQQFKSMNQSTNASQAALEETRRRFILSLQEQANEKLDELKLYIQSADVNASNYDLLPSNPRGQKFFRT